MANFERGDVPAGEIKSSEIQNKDTFDLPDDSGDVPYQTELPDDSGEYLSKELENIQKQDDVIEAVKSGDTPLEDTKQKGNFAEMYSDQIFREMGYERISLDMVTGLDDKGHGGIDAVYYNPAGKPPYIIVDAKYNTAQLAETKGGKQMSDAWIDARLDSAVGKERADEIREAMLDDNVGCYVVRVGVGDDVNTPVIFEKLDDNANVVSKGESFSAS